MSPEEVIKEVFKEMKAVDDLFLRAGLCQDHIKRASGTTPPCPGGWKHVTGSYQISTKEIEGLNVQEVVVLISKKRKAAMNELKEFLKKQVGKAKEFYALEGWFLKESLMWGVASKMEPRALELYTQQDAEPFDGATVYIDSTYAYA